MNIQLERKYLDELLRIVKQHVDTSKWQPVIFGSRAKGKARKFSDIDLGFSGSEPLPTNVQARLWDALDESDIPYVIDIVDLGATTTDFRKVAEKEMVSLHG